MHPPHNAPSQPDPVYAYTQDYTLKKLIGFSTALGDIFTKEKIAACERLIDQAKNSFFQTAQPDLDLIYQHIAGQRSSYPPEELYAKLMPPLSNIQAQAEMFGFSFIAHVCKHLMEYCGKSASDKRITARDRLIFAKLIETLRQSFQQKIVGAGGTLENELLELIGKENR